MLHKALSATELKACDLFEGVHLKLHTGTLKVAIHFQESIF